jgi:uncharacterized membrane protein
MAAQGFALYVARRSSAAARRRRAPPPEMPITVDLYQRGALAELLTFVWMPLAWIALEELLGMGGSRATKDEGRSRARCVAGLAAAVGALFWSHPPTAFTFTLVTGVLALVLAAP